MSFSASKSSRSKLYNRNSSSSAESNNGGERKTIPSSSSTSSSSSRTKRLVKKPSHSIPSHLLQQKSEHKSEPTTSMKSSSIRKTNTTTTTKSTENKRRTSLDEKLKARRSSVSSGGSRSRRNSTTTEENTNSTGEEISIQVCVRIRPLVINNNSHKSQFDSDSDSDSQSESGVEMEKKSAWSWKDNVITQDNIPLWANSSVSNGNNDANTKKTSYGFDHLFYPENETVEVYNTMLRDIVKASMKGYNSSIFAYGQTASGKTHTLRGIRGSPGVTSMAIRECFKFIQNEPQREFMLRVSYLEIYNELMNDLLSPATSSSQIQILHSKRKGTIIRGLKEEIVVSPEQVFSLLNMGEAQRHVGSTDMNSQSSRSHTIFRMVIESKSRKASTLGSSVAKSSTLCIIDLAGSECAKLTNANDERLKEGSYINKSLLTLGHVIHKLSEAQKNHNEGKLVHIPYRDSKLTRFLQPSLSGNAKVAIVCAINPTIACADETHNTLKFASRAKEIKLTAEINEVVDEATMLLRYRAEIERLKKELAKARHKNKINIKASSDSTGGRGSTSSTDNDLVPKMPTAISDIDINVEDGEDGEDGEQQEGKQQGEVGHSNSYYDEEREALINAIGKLERLILKSQVVAKSRKSNKPGSSSPVSGSSSSKKSGSPKNNNKYKIRSISEESHTQDDDSNDEQQEDYGIVVSKEKRNKSLSPRNKNQKQSSQRKSESSVSLESDEDGGGHIGDDDASVVSTFLMKSSDKIKKSKFRSVVFDNYSIINDSDNNNNSNSNSKDEERKSLHRRNAKSRESMGDLHNELQRIHRELNELLVRKNTEKSPLDTTVTLNKKFYGEEIKLVKELEDLKEKLNEQIASTQLVQADSNFLVNRLEEREKMILELEAVIEQAIVQTRGLEMENADLKKEVARLHQVLESREMELLLFKGLDDPSEETF